MWQWTFLNCGFSLLACLCFLNCRRIYSCDWNTRRNVMDFQFPLLFQTWTLSAAFHKGWWDNQQSGFLFSSLQDLTLKLYSSSSLQLSAQHSERYYSQFLSQISKHAKRKHVVVYKYGLSCDHCRRWHHFTGKQNETCLSVLDTDWQFDSCTLIRLDQMDQCCTGRMI